MANASIAAREAKARDLRERVVREGGTYHTIALSDNIVLPGEFDLRNLVDRYGIPEDLSGRTVLDVGTSTGFFAFECARRGGVVTAIDLWDGSLFREIRDLLGLSIRYQQKSLFDLDKDFGEFDLVVCGSVLVHLGDIFGALQRLRSVCRGEAIIATMATEVPGSEGRPLLEFIGHLARGRGDDVYGVYWGVSAVGLTRMCIAAGFQGAEVVGHFVLVSEPGKGGHRVPHVVVRASV